MTLSMEVTARTVPTAKPAIARIPNVKILPTLTHSATINLTCAACTSRPMSFSISYGGGEGDLPPSYLQRRCSEIMKLGLQGITVVQSSGDYGVASFPGDPSASGCGGVNENIFYPATDAACPYILAVGSTVLEPFTTDAPRCKLNEVATDRFGSGGGFSNVHPRADYQATHVQAYLDSVQLPFSGYTNFTGYGDGTSGVFHINGRGYPDVSAIGDNFLMTFEGGAGLIGGTSLSTPIWAGIITRINEERLAANKSTVGFINPILVSPRQCSPAHLRPSSLPSI